jgi:putative acetyltransferase
VEAVRTVNEAAFGRPDEARLVDRLRERARLYRGFVAVADGAVIGHILFTPVTLRGDQASCTIMALAPMALLPAHQRRVELRAGVLGGLDRALSQDSA